MPKIKIDQREVEVPPGVTILDAARKLGIDVPALCFFQGYKPSTSCLVCMVKVRDLDRLVPSCGTVAVDGMEVESETDEVQQARKTALELLLSDHLGDCLAPCHFACPAHMDVPLMLRQINSGNLRDAIVTVKNAIALPAVLGRVCPKPCEKGCRRGAADGAVAVCELKRYVADVDLACDAPYLPERQAASGKRVAIVGGGPTGLSAAYYLLGDGHAVAIFDDQPKLGGRLLHETTQDQLPRHVLDGEIALITRLGAQVHLNTPVGDEPSLKDLVADFDAVLVACGATKKDKLQRWGLKATRRGISVERESYRTNLEGVFAAGNAIRTKGLVVRSVGDGKEAAAAIGQHLAKQPVMGATKAFSSRMGKVTGEEMSEFLNGASGAPRQDPPRPFGGASPCPSDGLVNGFTLTEAVEQAGRCLHCDCRALETCKLRRYAALYGADPNRYRGQRAVFRQDLQHSRVIYEPGKCIDCGLCIEIASLAGEPLGLTFIGRGFDVRVGVPFDRSMEEALGKVAAQCVAACPTAALSFKTDALKSELPTLGQR